MQIVTHIFVCLMEVLNNNGISSSLSDSKLRPQHSSDKSWTPAEQSKGLSTAVKHATASLQRLSLGMYNNSSTLIKSWINYVSVSVYYNAFKHFKSLTIKK